MFFPHLRFEYHSLDPPHPTPPHPKHFKAHQNTKAIRGVPSCRRGRLTLFVNCRGRCLSLFVLCTCEHKLNDNLEISSTFHYNPCSQTLGATLLHYDLILASIPGTYAPHLTTHFCISTYFLFFFLSRCGLK